MVDQERRETFLQKYNNGAKIWSGGTFTGYLNLRSLLDELPVSDVAEASRDYPRRYQGMPDNIYGELIHNLLSFEGYLKDKAYHIEECAIIPIIRDSSFLYQFIIRYTTKEGEERVRTYEVARSDERNFIFFTDPLKS
uniref:Uncharacterized protein n=1 Tax=Desulfobacca acetoxidans TaxID=60893 RepID=A0A7C3UXW7_9BACT